MATPAVFEYEQIEQKDRQDGRPSKPHTKDYPSVGDGDGADQLKSRRTQQKREYETQPHHPVADISTRPPLLLYLVQLPFSS